MKKLEWGETSPTPLPWEQAMAWCKSLGDGWRAPTFDELSRQYNRDVGKPVGDGWTAYYYWSSATYQGYPTSAWCVNFFDGNVYADSKTNNYYVRAVRGGEVVTKWKG